MKEETRKIRYRLPIRIIEVGGNIKGEQSLLIEQDDQATFFDKEKMVIDGNGYIILDYGEEIAGGVRLITSDAGSCPCMTMRIRFGESVSETCAEIGEKNATNDHAFRDFEVKMPRYSDQSFGDTGFRFIRIDFKGEGIYTLKSILAKEWYRELEDKVSFKSDDELVNKIYETAKRTVTLNLQSRLWDGIKRDRLVWIGDMEPEIHALTYLYGNLDVVEQSIFTAEKGYPLPAWLNNIPTYSNWYLLIIYDMYKYSKDKEFLSRHIDYLKGVLNQFDSIISDDGDLNEMDALSIPSVMAYFIDWPTEGEDHKYKKSACVDLLKYTMPRIKEMLIDYGESTLVVDSISNKLQKFKTIPQTKKQLAAFHYLVEKDDESYKTLIEGGAKGLSTFMSYYILTAIADRDLDKAVEIMKEYYGGMLSRGATSFWEDFDIDWLENSSRIDEMPKKGEKDLHGDYGKYCYVGFRHSLCHGWSCGPVSFLLEQYKIVK